MAKQPDNDALQLLKADIKAGTPANLYFFHGEELFLLHHYLQQLKNAVLDELTESFNFHRFTPENFEMRDFADAVENLPMMAERTLVQVDEIDPFKLNEDSRSKLIEILSDIPDYCTVVFTYETTPWKPDKRLKKLYDAVSKGQIVEFPKQNQRDLVAWIQRHFMAQKKRIPPELCVYLIEITDGTMTSLAGEIKKIAAFSGAETVCKADIDAVTEPVLDAVVFRMTDQLGVGDYTAALITLQKLLKMQQEPIAILGAVGGHFRRISTARTLLDHGRNYSELMKLYGIADYPAKKAMDAARRFSQTFCTKASELILETDHQMKTSFDDSHRLLELLILRLAGEAKV
ncbi:MAG: DNA polymerase III subunit delta [Ruminococcaceae bacterium]|nr:DNA polymerase III subunit delta [Oscillospiraceae bacterium]